MAAIEEICLCSFIIIWKSFEAEDYLVECHNGTKIPRQGKLGRDYMMPADKGASMWDVHYCGCFRSDRLRLLEGSCENHPDLPCSL